MVRTSVFLPSHDAERYLSAVLLGDKLFCLEGKPASFLIVNYSIHFDTCILRDRVCQDFSLHIIHKLVTPSFTVHNNQTRLHHTL